VLKVVAPALEQKGFPRLDVIVVAAEELDSLTVTRLEYEFEVQVP
jgi:hypothetical protein